MFLRRDALRTTPKGSCFRCFARIFLPVNHFLQECLCLLFIHEGQTSHAFLCFEAVKECSILVVVPPVINLLVP